MDEEYKNYTSEELESKLDEKELVNSTLQKCPNCESTDLLEYIYGLPAGDYDKNKYILGGCEITPYDPIYRCQKCGYEIFKGDCQNNLEEGVITVNAK